MPIELQRRRPGSKKPVTPTTAFSLSSASVVAGSSRSTLPALIAAAIFGGSASASTLRPTASAVFGLTPGPTPPFAARDRLMQLERVAPERLVAERVEAEYLLPLPEQGVAAQTAAGGGGADRAGEERLAEVQDGTERPDDCHTARQQGDTWSHP